LLLLLFIRDNLAPFSY